MRSHSSSLSSWRRAERLALAARHRRLHLLEHPVLGLLVAARDAGVVDQHLDVAEVRRDALEHLAHRRRSPARRTRSRAPRRRPPRPPSRRPPRGCRAPRRARPRARSPATSPRRARRRRRSRPRPGPRTGACRSASMHSDLLSLTRRRQRSPRSTCPPATRPAPCRRCRRVPPSSRGASRAAAASASGAQLRGQARAGARAAAPADAAAAGAEQHRVRVLARVAQHGREHVAPSSRRAPSRARPGPRGGRRSRSRRRPGEPIAGQLEELARREVERDVRLAVGVDHDRVVAASVRRRYGRASSWCTRRRGLRRSNHSRPSRSARRRSRRRRPRVSGK